MNAASTKVHIWLVFWAFDRLQLKITGIGTNDECLFHIIEKKKEMIGKATRARARAREPRSNFAGDDATMFASISPVRQIR